MSLIKKKLFWVLTFLVLLLGAVFYVIFYVYSYWVIENYNEVFLVNKYRKTHIVLFWERHIYEQTPLQKATTTLGFWPNWSRSSVAGFVTIIKISSDGKIEKITHSLNFVPPYVYEMNGEIYLIFRTQVFGDKEKSYLLFNAVKLKENDLKEVDKKTEKMINDKLKKDKTFRVEDRDIRRLIGPDDKLDREKPIIFGTGGARYKIEFLKNIKNESKEFVGVRLYGKNGELLIEFKLNKMWYGTKEDWTSLQQKKGSIIWDKSID